jgi:hypothetical protein
MMYLYSHPSGLFREKKGSMVLSVLEIDPLIQQIDGG